MKYFVITVVGLAPIIPWLSISTDLLTQPGNVQNAVGIAGFVGLVFWCWALIRLIQFMISKEEKKDESL